MPYQTLAHFGPYQKLRDEKLIKLRLQNGPLWNAGFHNDFKTIETNVRDSGINRSPAVKDIIGKALPQIVTYKQLDNKKQVVALIDDVSRF